MKSEWRDKVNNQASYTVLAIFEAKSGQEKALKEILNSLIEPTLLEEGCLNYDLHECLDNPGQFMFYENWVNQLAHARHCEMPHIKEWQDREPYAGNPHVR
jgi:quinol monooxygenase YgiN